MNGTPGVALGRQDISGKISHVETIESQNCLTTLTKNIDPTKALEHVAVKDIG